MVQKIWDCKIGFNSDEELPDGSDSPMRQAVREAFLKVTGHEEEFLFSGWAGKLTAVEQNVVDSYNK